MRFPHLTLNITPHEVNRGTHNSRFSSFSLFIQKKDDRVWNMSEIITRNNHSLNRLVFNSSHRWCIQSSSHDTRRNLLPGGVSAYTSILWCAVVVRETRWACKDNRSEKYWRHCGEITNNSISIWNYISVPMQLHGIGSAQFNWTHKRYICSSA